jgi:hypothetical protein
MWSRESALIPSASIPVDVTGPSNRHCVGPETFHSLVAIRSLLLLYNRARRSNSMRLSYIDPPEGRMSADLQFLEEWIPEKMDPGTVFVLENQAKMGPAQNPFVAVMSCPRCGTMGLITRRQLCGGETMICGGDLCSAEYRLDGENIRFRLAQ